MQIYKKTICLLALLALIPLSAEAAKLPGTWAFTMHYTDATRTGTNGLNISSDTSRGTITVGAGGKARGRIEGGTDTNIGLHSQAVCFLSGKGIVRPRRVSCRTKPRKGQFVSTIYNLAFRAINRANRGPAGGVLTLVRNRVTLRIPQLPVLRGYLSMNKQMIILEGSNPAKSQNVTMTLIRTK